MSELSRLADQYVAVHLSDRAEKGSQNQKGNQFVQKTGQYKKVRSNSLRRLGISHQVVTYSKMRQTRISPVMLVSVSLSSVTTVRNPVISWLTVA